MQDRLRAGLIIAGILIVLTGLGFLVVKLLGSTPTTTTVAHRPQVRIWRVGQEYDSIKDSVADYLSANKSVQVTYTNKKTLEGYELSALKSLTSRKGPDIWSIPDDWLGDHFPRLSPIPDTYYGTTAAPVSASDYIKTIYPAGITDQLINPADGKVYGVPTAVDVLHLYYNPEVLNAALHDYITSLGDNPKDDQVQPVSTLLRKPPTTWSDLVDQTRYITKRDGNTITRSSIAMGTAANVPESASILQLLMMQNGAKITSSDHKNALFDIPDTTASGVQSRPGENALSFYTSFADPSKPTYTWNASLPDALDAFAQGKVAMVLGFSTFGDTLKAKYPKFQFEVAAAPQISAASLQPQTDLIRFWTETVPTVADNTAAAFGIIRAYATKPQPIASGYKLTSPLLTALNNDPKSFPYQQILNGKAVYKKNRPVFDEDFQQMITDVSQNGLTPAQSLASGADKINNLLAQADE